MSSGTKNNFRANVFSYDRQSTTLNYTPDIGFTGNNIIKYTVSDGKGGSASAEVHVFVGTNVVVDEGGDDQGGDGSGQGGGVTKDDLTGNESYGRISGLSKITGAGGKAVEGHFEVFDEFGNWVDIWEYNQEGIAFNNSTGAYDIDLPPEIILFRFGLMNQFIRVFIITTKVLTLICWKLIR